MKRFFLYIWTFWCYFSLTIIFILSVPIGLFLSFVSSSLFACFTFYLAKIILFFIGSKIIVHGKFPIESKDPVIYIANHASYLDPVLTSYLVKKKYKYLGKEEVLSWPIFGTVVKRHMVAVKRELKTSRFDSMDLMKESLAQGYSIILYPEGGWKDDNRKHPYNIKPNAILNQFRNGAFRLAIDSKVKIVPITLCNANKIHSSETMMFSPGKVVIFIHNKLETKDLSLEDKDIQELNNKCYSIIYNNLIKNDCK